MGLHLPGASFVNPNTPLRDALTARPRQAGAGDHRAGQRLHAGRRDHRRAGDRQRRRRACTPPAARPTTRSTSSPSRARPASSSPGTTSPTSPRSCRCSAAIYPERLAGREPLPRRRRHELPDPRAARRRAAARGRAHGGRGRRAWRATAQEPLLDGRRRSPGATGAATSRDETVLRAGRTSRSAPKAGSSCSTAISAGR